MQEDTSSEQFGMTEEDTKDYKYKSFFGKVSYYFDSIEPTLVKILNSIIYTSLKFIKGFVTTVIRMILGKEV